MSIISDFVANKITWTKGRGMGNYFNHKIFESHTFNCDAYLIYYPEGGYVNPHYDPSPAPGYEHHRLNITLVKAKSGGTFKYATPGSKMVNYYSGRVKHFRPDTSRHWVTKVAKGYRLMLSFGWLRKI